MIGWKCDQCGKTTYRFVREGARPAVPSRSEFEDDEPSGKTEPPQPTEKDIPLGERWGLRPSPEKWPCKGCGKLASRRICPECREELPKGFEKFAEAPGIAVIGATMSGKTHFMEQLIAQIQKNMSSSEFGWSLHGKTTSSIDLHESRSNQLTGAKTTLGGTQKGGIAQPYGLKLDKQRELMLALFDSAGEENAEVIQQYIARSFGVMCVVDPLQLEAVREALLAAGHTEKELPDTHVNRSTAGIIEYAVGAVKEGKGRVRGRDIPLAVVFSKMDFVADAGKDARAVYEALRRPTLHRGAFHEGEFRDLDARMRSWVAKVGNEIRGAVANAADAFPTTGFFGCSALGCNPVGGNQLQETPHSWRVEDPLLWILAKNGLIETRND